VTSLAVTTLADVALARPRVGGRHRGRPRAPQARQFFEAPRFSIEFGDSCARRTLRGRTREVPSTVVCPTWVVPC
jgi:hypothetical protein